jgi:AraC-like DNA-binding protein
VAVAAHSVKRPSVSDNHGLVRLRTADAIVAGAYVHQGDALTSGWHTHDLHQLEYAVEGLVEVKTAAGHHLLPSQQMAWIPAGLEHQSVLHTSVRTISVFFDPTLLSGRNDRVRILAAAPLVREMLLHAVRWPIGRRVHDARADRFFRAMADVIEEALDAERPLTLPTCAHPLVARATGYVRVHLDSVTVSSLCQAMSTSERTMRRLFQAELAVTCREYLLQARLLQAMVLLARSEQAVVDAATAVGFSSSSAFARTFRQRCGESPSAFRRRMHPRGDS